MFGWRLQQLSSRLGLGRWWGDGDEFVTLLSSRGGKRLDLDRSMVQSNQFRRMAIGSAVFLNHTWISVVLVGLDARQSRCWRSYCSALMIYYRYRCFRVGLMGILQWFDYWQAGWRRCSRRVWRVRCWRCNSCRYWSSGRNCRRLVVVITSPTWLRQLDQRLGQFQVFGILFDVVHVGFVQVSVVGFEREVDFFFVADRADTGKRWTLVSDLRADP